MHRFARRLLLLAGVSIGLSGCLSPTLPMPPPAKPDIEQIGDGQYRVTGRIPSSGYVDCLNLRTDLKYGQLSRDGRYSFPIVAQPEDQMLLWYEVNEENSEILEFEIPPAPAAPAPDGGTGN